MSELRPCPLCSEHLWPCNEGFEHPASDTCPLDNMWFPERLVAAWNTRATPTLSAAMELPEIRALVEAARKTLVAAELREIYHRLPNDKNRIGDPKSPKAKARDAWLKAFRRASSATSLALAAIKEPKT